jgi:hypothetical protein
MCSDESRMSKCLWVQIAFLKADGYANFPEPLAATKKKHRTISEDDE